jgi:hypothetical protein
MRYNMYEKKALAFYPRTGGIWHPNCLYKCRPVTRPAFRGKLFEASVASALAFLLMKRRNKK